MNIITAKSFLEAWLEAIEEKKEFLKTDWRNAKAFTHLIKGCEDNLISIIAAN